MSDTTYSTNLALTLLGLSPDDVWGGTTNNNLGTLIEQAISGYAVQNFTDADITLVMSPGVSATARNMYIECTGTNTATRSLIVPPNEKLYFVYNNTSGVSNATASQATISNDSGTGIGNILTIGGTITGIFVAGQTISGTGIISGTKIVNQISGTPGEAGTYTVDIAQNTIATSTASYIAPNSSNTPTLTVGGSVTGTFAQGQDVVGPGVTTGTTIVGYQTGAGGVGTYTVDIAQGPTAASTSNLITGTSMVVTGPVSGTLTAGQVVSGPGITVGTTIQPGSYTGGADTYTISPTQDPATSSLASLSGGVLTIGGTVSGTFAVGQQINDTFGILSGVDITSLGSGLGGLGTYIASGTQTLPTATTWSISTTSLTVSSTTGTFGIGQVLSGTGIIDGTTIIAGTSSPYTIDTSQTIVSGMGTLTISAYPVSVTSYAITANTPVAITSAPVSITGSLPGGGYGIFVTADNATGVLVDRGSKKVVVYDGTLVVEALTGLANTTNSSASNILGGVANEIVYQTGTNQTGFITSPTTPNQFLQWTGSQFVWSVGSGGGGTTSNSLTFNSSGSGLASPVAFNGSAAQTISYNTLGAIGLSSFTGTNASKTTNGWQKLPGGIILQWGYQGITNSTFTFPTPFPTKCLNFIASNSNTQGAGVDNAFGYPTGATSPQTQFFLATKGSYGPITSYPCYWFAIGY
jgi:hypothetical protein